MYIVKLNGDKIKYFVSPIKAQEWAKHYCMGKGKVQIVALKEGRLPHAEKAPQLYIDERGVKSFLFHGGVTVRTIK